ncbi:MAG: phosphoenolpyruvate carboxylase, partial [Ilumatobacter sp.]
MVLTVCVSTDFSERSPANPSFTDASGNEALGDDIRLLGRLLGDVVRDQAGDDTFELVEAVRKVAVSGRRSGTSSVAGLENLLDSQPIDQVLHVVR